MTVNKEEFFGMPPVELVQEVREKSALTAYEARALVHRVWQLASEENVKDLAADIRNTYRG
jgi:hypothetical protein